MRVKKGRDFGSLDPAAWSELLPNSDFDYNFIIEGVKNGFNIMNNLSDLSFMHNFGEPVICNNYKSALNNTVKVEKQLLSEFALGNYQLSNTPPLLVSALGDIPKRNGSVRLIHDASLPEVLGINC